MSSTRGEVGSLVWGRGHPSTAGVLCNQLARCWTVFSARCLAWNFICSEGSERGSSLGETQQVFDGKSQGGKRSATAEVGVQKLPNCLLVVKHLMQVWENRTAKVRITTVLLLKQSMKVTRNDVNWQHCFFTLYCLMGKNELKFRKQITKIQILIFKKS